MDEIGKVIDFILGTHGHAVFFFGKTGIKVRMAGFGKYPVVWVFLT